MPEYNLLWRPSLTLVNVLTAISNHSCTQDHKKLVIFEESICKYRQTPNVSRTLVGNKIDHSDVVEVSPIGVAPTTFHSRLNTWLQWNGQRQLQDETRNISVLGVGVPYIWSLMVLQRADYRLAPSHWETSLQSNVVSHWLGTNLESALLHTDVTVITPTSHNQLPSGLYMPIRVRSTAFVVTFILQIDVLEEKNQLLLQYLIVHSWPHHEIILVWDVNWSRSSDQHDLKIIAWMVISEFVWL